MSLPTSQIVEQKERIQTNDLPQENFNLKQVIESWNLFLKKLKSDCKIPTYNALMTTIIDLKNDNEIIFEFSSYSSKQEFEEHKKEVEDTMKFNLKNHYFTIKTKFSEKESENLILSKKEKFEILSSRNPILLKLKEEFGLDLFE